MSKPGMTCPLRLRRATFVVLVLACTSVAGAQPGGATSPLPPATAFVNVNVITMADDRVRAGQVVIVRGGRVVAMGSRSQIPVPEQATVIDGTGRYLLPGLTDSHVHLDGDGTRRGSSRDNFGDGPLYLAHGVTSVVNLRGLPEHLDWRRRVAAGELTGPTIYTAGEFVNEPRVFTPDEVQAEIESQQRDGYDLIKFREVYSREDGVLTTVGLPLESYRRMNEVARTLQMPLTGHAPVNLDLDALLDARQTLAHVGALTNLYILPMAANPGWLAATAAAFAALTGIAIWTGLQAFLYRRRTLPQASPAVARLRMLAGAQLFAGAIAAASAILFLPGGPFFDSELLRLVFTATMLVATMATSVMLFATLVLWRDPGSSLVPKLQAVVALGASGTLAFVALAFWVPVVWRSSDRGVDRLAQRLQEAGITVQTTLVTYDAIGGPGRQVLVDEPAIDFLRPDVQARWRRLRTPAPRLRYTDFMKKVTGALHRAGVPLVAGTDAMGYPLMTPGASLLRELELLVDSGLPPYDAIYAATAAAAHFLGRDTEFGRVVPGRRADLILLEDNPLEDIHRLRHPVGVMARGTWYPRAELLQMMARLKVSDREPSP